MSNKCVFNQKYDKNENLQKYKARLVAKGYSQTRGMDYKETFALVVHLETICTLLALAVAEDWEIGQMDIKRAYLNSTIKEEIYMKQPDGYNNKTGCLCRLIESLYGLKQAGCEWNDKFNKQLETHGWRLTKVDPCAYFKQTAEGIINIAVWVDNLLIFASLRALMNAVKLELQSIFEVTDLGEPTKIVGICYAGTRSQCK